MFCDYVAEIEVNGETQEVRCMSSVKNGEHFLESHRLVVYVPLED